MTIATANNVSTALEQYSLALEKQGRALKELIEHKQTISIARETIKAFEAEIIVNGGCGGIVIDGRNAEIREAQVVAASSRHDLLTQTRDKLRVAEHRAAECEAEIDIATNAMRWVRLLVEWETSINNRLAGVEAGNGYRRQI